MVALADHGLTPSAIAARLTLAGAPDALPGALAAGLLGGGSRLLGVTEDCARFLPCALADHEGMLPSPGPGSGPGGPDAIDAAADAADAAGAGGTRSRETRCGQ